MMRTEGAHTTGGAPGSGGRSQRIDSMVIGRAAGELVTTRLPMFLRTVGATGSGRSIALLAFVEQMLQSGGAVLWIDGGYHARVVTALGRMAARYSVQYAKTHDYVRGDEAVVAAITARGGIGHCVPDRDAAQSGHSQQLTRLRIGNALFALSELASGSRQQLLVIFNQVVGAYEGRALGLGGLPAKMRSAGHSLVFSDTSINVDALDVAAQSRQFLFHRLDGKQAARHARLMVPGARPTLRAASDWSNIAGDDAMGKQISVLVDEYAVFSANGEWTLIKTAAPSLYGARSGQVAQTPDTQPTTRAEECVQPV